MFTGIVRSIGSIIAVEADGGGGRRLRIDARGIGRQSLAIGASLCVSGVCLTVVESQDGRVAADVSARTLADTVLGDWDVGQEVNIEPSLAAGEPLGGHFVMGHVDGAAEVVARRADGRSVELSLWAPNELLRFVAPKGSVALDGVSLTVNDMPENRFTVNLVPHTLKETTLSGCRVGSRLNLELDIIARYAARLLER